MIQVSITLLGVNTDWPVRRPRQLALQAETVSMAETPVVMGSDGKLWSAWLR
jgi:hypothetical protein